MILCLKINNVGVPRIKKYLPPYLVHYRSVVFHRYCQTIDHILQSGMTKNVIKLDL